MDLVSILVTLIILGFVLYLISLIPMPDFVRKIIYSVACLFVVLWLLSGLGFIHAGNFRLR